MQNERATALTELSLTIDGMSCGKCVERVTGLLGRIPGVGIKAVSVGKATVAVPDATAAVAVVTALNEAGYSTRRDNCIAAPSRPARGRCSAEWASAQDTANCQ